MQLACWAVANLLHARRHPPPCVSQLGVASVVTFGVALLHTTVRALPLSKSTTSMAAKGLWLVGGLVVLARLTGGTLAHLGGMFGRNAARKRRLARKLRAVEVRRFARHAWLQTHGWLRSCCRRGACCSLCRGIMHSSCLARPCCLLTTPLPCSADCRSASKSWRHCSTGPRSRRGRRRMR